MTSFEQISQQEVIKQMLKNESQIKNKLLEYQQKDQILLAQKKHSKFVQTSYLTQTLDNAKTNLSNFREILNKLQSKNCVSVSQFTTLSTDVHRKNLQLKAIQIKKSRFLRQQLILNKKLQVLKKKLNQYPQLKQGQFIMQNEKEQNLEICIPPINQQIPKIKKQGNPLQILNTYSSALVDLRNKRYHVSELYRKKQQKGYNIELQMKKLQQVKAKHEEISSQYKENQKHIQNIQKQIKQTTTGFDRKVQQGVQKYLKQAFQNWDNQIAIYQMGIENLKCLAKNTNYPGLYIILEQISREASQCK